MSDFVMPKFFVDKMAGDNRVRQVANELALLTALSVDDAEYFVGSYMKDWDTLKGLITSGLVSVCYSESVVHPSQTDENVLIVIDDQKLRDDPYSITPVEIVFLVRLGDKGVFLSEINPPQPPQSHNS